jgi:diadenosine tetraphosphate (Ap4A) HIT family hydrolase
VTAPWRDRIAGLACPLCAPRPDRDDERFLVRRLSVSSLYLDRNQGYRGHCVLVFDPRHAVRIDQLSHEEWQALAADLQAASAAIMASLRPDHLNLDSLGNVVPHLHWHLFPRYQDDARWGRAVWTTDTRDMPDLRLDEAGYADLAALIASALPERPAS